MNEQRLAQLFKFLEEDKNDPFTLYAIALEFQTENPKKAMEYFEELLQNHADYTGTYYHAAKLYSFLGKKKAAEKVFLKGLEICKVQGEHHAFKELQNAYNEFLFEEED
jgi:Tfp pilus assembly protein PilF